MSELTHTKQVIHRLKTKYPVVFSKFQDGTADLSILTWIIDNIDTIREKKLPYKVVKETNLESVLPDGTHIYKTYDSPAIIAENAVCADEPTPEVSKPADLDSIVAELLPRFAGMETTKEFAKGEDYFASFCHSQLSGGIGMHIRNDYDLWIENSPQHLYFKSKHNCQHPDDMSDVIIRAVYKAMKNVKSA